MTVEVHVIMCHVVDHTGTSRHGYVGRLSHECGTNKLEVRVIYDEANSGIFDDEARNGASKFFSRRQAQIVRDYIVAKLTVQEPTLTEVVFDVVPRHISPELAAQLAVSPVKLDMSK